MPWRRVYLAGCLLLSLSVLRASEADALREKAIAALKESQTNPRALIEAARASARSAQIYTAAANETFAAEMNAYLFWCRKKMSVVAVADYTKGGDKDSNDAFAAIDKAADPQKAKPSLESAEAFAEAWPNEHYLCAIRFFEVAERFKETLPGLTARERHLNALANAEEAAGLKKEAPPPKDLNVIPAAEVDAAPLAKDERLRVPPAAAVAEADKRVKALYKDDYAKRKPDERSALAKKLLEKWNDSGNDEDGRYAHLIAARDVAAEAGDARTAMAVVDRLAEKYLVNVTAERSTAFKKLLEVGKPTPEVCRFIADSVIRAFDEAIAAEQFPALKQLAIYGDTAAKKSDGALLIPRMKAKLALLDEIQREWTACKAALEVFKADKNNPAANLTVGRFYCFMKGDFARGLRCLARSTVEPLKKVALADQLSPAEAPGQAALGDAWWDLSEKEPGKQAQLSMMSRANYWYSKAHPSLPPADKGKGEKRMAKFAERMQIYEPPLYEMPGRWSVKWAKHPERAQKSVEIHADGSIRANAADFGENVPDRWTFKDQRILFHFKSSMICGMEVVDENTLKQEPAFGEMVFTRVKK